ncbi:EF-P lysine aminoacylase GenX [Motiliproteus coralliicola]|uniref:EF-P lysine aminoacylase GenX n=1 Tax=Motiliproteus coralliicola TaxID=2283196 RepID=A0A369WGB8_9GAMM|nr:EF-P lysine aminoacylase EpmA [Motiliproteus coralliicola]RDE19656.1 EF-P lysine aminoacylase GenX [Motiliproteus coralliicola]
MQWQPTASLEAIQARAELYAQIRSFFAERSVLEVDTPVLSQAAVSDPYLVPMISSYSDLGVDSAQPLFLQTSPEYAMKRLLAAGSGPIYQLAKAFRDTETGSRHNPEFCMLEWYRPGFDDRQLMDEIEELVDEVLGCGLIERLSYRELFERQLGFDPHRVELAVLRQQVKQRLDLDLDSDDRDDFLNLLISHELEPTLIKPTFVYNYPASQAALARVDQDEQGQSVAKRFELFVNGVELANGYFELTEADEQARRFERDLARRQQLGYPCHPTDQRLVAALQAGIPECAGVALGVDRLLMLKLGVERIEQVIAFPLAIA